MVLPSSSKFVEFALWQGNLGAEGGWATWNQPSTPDCLQFKAISLNSYFLNKSLHYGLHVSKNKTKLKKQITLSNALTLHVTEFSGCEEEEEVVQTYT